MSQDIGEIREIRIEELNEAVQLAQQWGGTMGAANVRRRLSLLARSEQDEVIGVALCTGVHGCLTLEVSVSEQASDDLPRQLVDKALSKLRCEKVRRCAIRVTGDDQTAELFTATRWSVTTDAKPTAKPAAAPATAA